MPSPPIGFTGSRSLSPRWAAFVAGVVGRAFSAGFSAAWVGCARGADLFVRQAAAPSVRVFRASSRRPRDLVARSVSLVRALAAQPGAVLVGFADEPCPAGIVPDLVWQSGVPPSGTWSSIALGAGLGLPVYVFGLMPRSCIERLPSWPGSWSPVGPGTFCGSWRWQPDADQPELV